MSPPLPDPVTAHALDGWRVLVIRYRRFRAAGLDPSRALARARGIEAIDRRIRPPTSDTAGRPVYSSDGA